ncbi:MAG: hypothetical protein FWF94_00575 [Oscillospiraceae bacterium]|nr:hypothetical protein [Oscillospiraceae bacterium]
MTLSRNEQIAVFILIFIIVAAAGVILFIWPQYNSIKDNKALLDSKKAEFVRLEDELGFSKFEKMEKEIVEAYEDGRDVSENFYEEELTAYNADRLVRDVLQGVGLNTDNLIVNQLSTHSLMLSIFRDTDISYPIKDLATIGNADDVSAASNDAEASGEEGENNADNENNDNDEAAAAEPAAAPAPVAVAPSDDDDADLEAMVAYLMNAPRVGALDYYEQNMANPAKAVYVVTAMREFLSNESETVAMQSVQFEIPLTKEEAFALSMYVYNLPNASYITSITHRELDGTTNADGEVVNTAGGKRLYTVNMMFFIVEPMEEPNFTYATRFNWSVGALD